MAQVRYRANLSAKDFVFSSQDWGRSVILKQYDQNFSRQIVSPTDPDKDIGIPQIFYCHNVMPCAQGFQSVGIVQAFANTGIGAGEQAYQCLQWEYQNSVAGNGGSRGYFLITYAGIVGTNYSFNIYTAMPGITNWVKQQTINISRTAAIIRFSTALVGGVTYLYAPYNACYTFDGTTWSTVTLSGIDMTKVIGITASYGYMIAWNANAIAWSSTLTPTDFTPSLITGAGGGSVNALKGGITWCQHHTFGIIVFSALNCVAAVYSGNARYPFNFREIIGGGGFSGTTPLADLDSESGNLYAYTTAGMQIVSVTQAQVVYPEVTNYLGGSRFEDFNDDTLAFSETDVTPGAFNRQVTVIAERYLVISYGIINTFPITYTHALVYDIAMKRWGKIRFTHVAPVEGLFSAPSLTENTTRTSLCFLDINGVCWNIDFSQLATSGGTIFLGRYQHARDRLITLLQADLDFIPQTTKLPTVNIFSTLDGKTFLPPVKLTPISVTGAPQYPARITAMNHSLCIQGIFRLDSLMLTYTASGRR